METLAVAGIGKSYDGNVALHDVSFEVPKGAILAICGENGAGKSTLMKILSGATGPDQGEIRIDGSPIRLADPHDAIARGIHIVHQELSLLPHLSVAENMLLGKTPHRNPRWVIDWAETNRIAASVLLDLGFDHIDVRLRVAELGVSVQQIVEIGKALAGEPQVLILDEPTAVLSLHETELLFRTVRRLAAAGTMVIYISHRLEEVFQIAHRVLVLKDGARVIESDIGALDNDGLIRAMVGRPLTAIYPKRQDPVGDPILECRGLTLTGIFNDIGFDIRSGEIVGMFGLVGSGRTDVDLAAASTASPSAVQSTLLTAETTMAKYTAEQFDEWIADYEARRTRAKERIYDIEKDGIRHYEVVRNEPMRDVTDELLKDLKDEVKMWERLIDQYKKWKAAP